MSLRRRVAKSQTIPAEPILPSVTVTRKGLMTYNIKLDTADRGWYSGYITAFGKYRHTNWKARGTQKHAQEKAQRILNRYMRRLGYTNSPAVRFVAKDPS